jgi:serine/threonine protein kinase/WD40 repeat protein
MGEEPDSMTPPSREQEVFAAALDCVTVEARAAYLENACGRDHVLRDQVEALLRATEAAGDFLEFPPSGLTGSDRAADGRVGCSEQAGGRIGRYQLLEQIGEGGCGVVYMAEQEEPVRRRVALKVIKLGMDTKSVIARFEAERQALALMDHPNIAKVFDAGATATGRPYFVMELVRGSRITDYCDANNLATAARLKLFTQVCDAIQHAHQKGIIHRDIKPSNVLVTSHEPGSPACPKVIDFGIAKATTGQRLTDMTIFTAFEQFIGTPAYMSPEQAMMTSLDIDTRTDIYALGVLLYELLTGQTPFDAQVLMAEGLDSMRRIIQEQEPVRPSTRLSTLMATDRSAVANRRHAEPAMLGSLLKGDLDWIVMKALEKDRRRRYETANGLAADIRRHLANEPVTARPPTAAYRFQKLALRHRGAFVAAGSVLVGLLVAVVSLATSNARIRQEQNRKEIALGERGTALNAARASEQRAREHLFLSLRSQAQARRNSRQMGQRLESLAALAEAANIRPEADLRDSAIAAMALPDVEHGPTWPGWGAGTTAIAHDPQNDRFARIGSDGSISVRSHPGDRELQRLTPRTGVSTDAKVRQFAFSPDGRFLVWRDADGHLELWRCQNGETVLPNPPEDCTSLVFSQDGKRVAIGHGHWISCHHLDTGEEIRRWRARDQIHALDYNPDNRRLAVGYGAVDTVSIYDADDGQELAVLSTGNSNKTVVAWHPDGELLASGGSDARIFVWDVKAGRSLVSLVGHAQQVNFLGFHCTGDILASMSWDGTLRLWRPNPGRLLMRLPARSMFAGQAGRWSGVIATSSDQAQLWGIVPSREHQTFLNTFRSGESQSREGDISPDGTLLALAASDGVRLWDVARGREAAWLRMADTTSAIFRADGRELLTCGPADGLQRWRIESDDTSRVRKVGPPRQIPLPFSPTRMVKGSDDLTIAVVGETTGQCIILDLTTEKVNAAEMPQETVAFVAVSPDGGWLATSAWHSSRIHFWDARGGTLVKEWDAGSGSRVFFTPDNRELIVASGGDFTFHDVGTLEVTRKLPREIGLFPGIVAFTADGKLMALEMAPGIIHLKETASGRTVAQLEDLPGHQSTWLAFTPDGTQLVVASKYADTIHRWDLRAIRARLQSMKLDWDWPEFAEPSPSDVFVAEIPRPVQIQVVDTPRIKP